MTYPYSQTNPRSPKRYSLFDQLTLDRKAYISIGLRQDWGVYNQSSCRYIKTDDIAPRSAEAFAIDRKNRLSWIHDFKREKDTERYFDLCDYHVQKQGYNIDNLEILTSEMLRIPGPQELILYPAFPLRDNLVQTFEQVAAQCAFKFKRQFFVDMETYEDLQSLKKVLGYTVS